MKTRGTWLLLFGSCLLLSSNAHSVLERNGNLGVGARAQGMGGAWVALADDLSALYWNPAALIRLQPGDFEVEIASFQNEKDVNVGFRGVGQLNSEIRFAAAMNFLERSSPGSLDERWLSFGIAVPLNDKKFGFGIAAKPIFVRGPLPELSGNGFAMDFGLIGQWDISTRAGLKWGLAFHDLMSGFKWKGGLKEKLPSWFSLGLGASIGVDTMLGLDLSSLASGQAAPGKKQIFRGGVETWILEGHIGLRMGYAGRRTGLGQFTGGFSFRSGAWQVHYSLMASPDRLGASHRVTWVQALGLGSWVRPGTASPETRERITHLERKLRELVRAELVLRNKADGSKKQIASMKKNLDKTSSKYFEALKPNQKLASPRRAGTSSDPGVPTDLFERGKYYFGRGEYGMTVSILRSAQTKRNQDPELRELFRKAVKLASPTEIYEKEHMDLYERGFQNMLGGQFKEEAVVWNQMLKYYPGDPKLQDFLKTAQQRSTRLKMIEDLEKGNKD